MDIVQGVRLLKEQLVKPGVAHKFHSIGSLEATSKKPTTSFLLVVSRECEEKANIRIALKAFTDLSAMSLIAARTRPERSHRPLSQELEDLLGQSSNRRK